MKKILLVSITNKTEGCSTITMFSILIDCSSDEEANIKHNLESKKNDPVFFVSFINRYVSEEKIQSYHSHTKEMKDMITTCESITVEFFESTDEKKVVNDRIKQYQNLFELNPN